jgi:hypothetical protein
LYNDSQAALGGKARRAKGKVFVTFVRRFALTALLLAEAE